MLVPAAVEVLPSIPLIPRLAYTFMPFNLPANKLTNRTGIEFPACKKLCRGRFSRTRLVAENSLNVEFLKRDAIFRSRASEIFNQDLQYSLSVFSEAFASHSKNIASSDSISMGWVPKGSAIV